MALSTAPYKGARDFYPEDKRLQKYMFSVMRSVVERFGYEEYDAPILEPTELYASKTSDEIVAEQTYSFIDRGDRPVTIRTEMTPSVSRMVAGRRQELAYPLRWYSIPNLWRYERPQRGRVREFWQLNIDIFGLAGIEADHEVILVADSLMKSFGAKRDMYTIKLNSRKLMNALLGDHFGLDATQSASLIRLIDRKHKIEPAAFTAQADALFTPSQREQGHSDQLLEFLKGTRLDQLPQQIQEHESTQAISRLMALLDEGDISNVVFDPTLMRGFDYYTDIVFEVFDEHPDNNRSLFGGGRYDGLVGLFGVDPVPTVGFGMGDVPLQNFLESHGLLPTLPTETEVCVITIGDVYPAAQKVADELREMGVKTTIDPSDRKTDKKIRSADKKGIPYALFIGELELAEERYRLKNLHTGVEEHHSSGRIVSIIKDYRKS